jgi:hypothetical protein
MIDLNYCFTVRVHRHRDISLIEPSIPFTNALDALVSGEVLVKEPDVAEEAIKHYGGSLL